MTSVRLMLGDCLERMAELDDGSVDAIVTDPPYGLLFMGKGWDCSVPSVAIWAECLRVLKPGGHVVAFSGTRTYHRMAVAVEDAGFEIRDQLAWIYGTGFPKSHDVSKGIDKAAGAEREIVGKHTGRKATPKQDVRGGKLHTGQQTVTIDLSAITAPATPEAQQWQGWGTALKPAWEPIVFARKPLIGTVAANVLEHGTGAINIDGCRVGVGDHVPGGGKSKRGANSSGGVYGDGEAAENAQPHTLGRWPANLLHDGSDEVVGLFPNSVSSIGNKGTDLGIQGGNFAAGAKGERRDKISGFSDSGSAARFFYSAKASKKDRDEGNTHPTVKPTALMQWLCRLVTPPGGVVLDPFMGSGSTGKAAVLEGFRFVGCERDPSYFAIAEKRIQAAQPALMLQAAE